MLKRYSTELKFVVVGLIVITSLGWSPARHLLARFTWNDYVPSADSLHEDVTISKRDAVGDSPGALIVEYAGAGRHFVPLFTIPRSELQDGKWFFLADAEKMEGTVASLELRYYLDDGPPVSSPSVAQYDQNKDPRSLKLLTVSLPWYTISDRVKLGLSFDGPGSVYVENMELFRKPIRHMGFGTTSAPISVLVVVFLLVWIAVSPRLMCRPPTRSITLGIQLLLLQLARGAVGIGLFGTILMPGGTLQSLGFVFLQIGILGTLLLMFNGRRLSPRKAASGCELT